jgi:glycosyltransferase involved in cell wall biosynthesis
MNENPPKTRPRVALLRNTFLPYSETFIHDELRFHERYDVTVFARRLFNADRFPGHRVFALDSPGRRMRAASAWYGLSTRSPYLEREMREGGFSLLHAHFGHNGVYALGFARRLNLPLVVSLHGGDVTVLLSAARLRPQWWNYLIRYRRMFREARLFLAASNELKELIVSCGCPAEKVIVHRLGVDLGTFKPADLAPSSDPPIVLMVGRFVEKKGHVYGIEAAALALKAGLEFRLVIVGNGPLLGQYRSLISRLGLDDTVSLPGALSHVEIVELLHRTSVLVAPSVVARNLDRESGIIVVKEAAASGIPVVGTRHGGIPEIIDDGTTGFMVPERDARALSERLVELLRSRELRLGLGRAARAKMEREYDIRERVRALEGIYDRVIGAS